MIGPDVLAPSARIATATVGSAFAATPGGLLQRRLRRFPRVLRRQSLIRALLAARRVDRLQLIEFDGGASAWVDLRDAESRAALLSGRFWPEVASLFTPFLSTGGVVLDGGAGLGLVSLSLAHATKGSEIAFHLFDANPRGIPCLERSALLWPGRILVRHACLTDRPGTSRHVLRDDCWGRGWIAEEGDEVSNLCLDDYVVKQRIEKVAFLKLDVEGWEPFAIRGFSRALSSGVVAAGYVELSRPLLARVRWSAEDLLALLESLGFAAYFLRVRPPSPVDESEWKVLEIGGSTLHVAMAIPLPARFDTGDVLIAHRTSAIGGRLAAVFRS